jgi:hypothetical protein
MVESRKAKRKGARIDRSSNDKTRCLTDVVVAIARPQKRRGSAALQNERSGGGADSWRLVSLRRRGYNAGTLSELVPER